MIATAEDKRIAELEADVAVRDKRILFLEGQCRLLASEVDRLNVLVKKISGNEAKNLDSQT